MSSKRTFEHFVEPVQHARAWIDPEAGIMIRAFEPGGDPVELAILQARELGEALIKFADIEENWPDGSGGRLNSG